MHHTLGETTSPKRMTEHYDRRNHLKDALVDVKIILNLRWHTG
jgi:hypothetical protein